MPNHPGLEYTKMEMDVFYGAITHVFAHTPGFFISKYPLLLTKEIVYWIVIWYLTYCVSYTVRISSEALYRIEINLLWLAIYCI